SWLTVLFGPYSDVCGISARIINRSCGSATCSRTCAVGRASFGISAPPCCYFLVGGYLRRGQFIIQDCLVPNSDFAMALVYRSVNNLLRALPRRHFGKTSAV